MRRAAASSSSRAACTGCAGADAHARAAEVLDALELAAAADRPTETYSGGMRRRLDVGLGIVHRPVGPVPRRADDRPRPAGPRPHVGRDPQAPRRRHDRLPHDPLPRGGRRPVRPPRDHRPRPDRGRGHGRRAQARDRRRRRSRSASTASDGARPRQLLEAQPFVREASIDDGARPPLRRPTARRAVPAAPPPARRRGPRAPDARRSTGPASTTSSCARPADRCARTRHDRRRRPRRATPTKGSSAMRVFHDTWLDLPPLARADRPAARLAHRRGDAADPLPGPVRPAPRQRRRPCRASRRRRIQLFVPGLLVQIALFGRRSSASGSSPSCATASSSGCGSRR